MRFSLVPIVLFVSASLTACSDSDHYPVPPEYNYDTPKPQATEEQKTTPSNTMLSIALSMGEKPAVVPNQQQKPKILEATKPPTIPVAAVKTKPTPEKPANNSFKELDFASAAKEKKITTVKLKNEESTRSGHKREKTLYSSSERGRFQKTDQRGAAIDNKSEQWFCVKDNSNDILWEAKTTGKQRHSQHTYSIEGGIGSCGQAQCSPQQYIDRLNKMKLCGRSNWRLPKKRELTSLAKNQHNQGKTSIDDHYFPNTQANYYWSSTPFEYAKNRTWAVDFSSGFEKSQAKIRAFHLRLVSSD